MNTKSETHPAPIKVTRQQITDTEAFAGLNPILKSMTLRRGSVMAIEHGVNVTTNIGFDTWDRQTATRYTNRMIVKEIVESKTCKQNEIP